MVSAYKKSRMQPVQELWKMLKLHTPLNDRNRMIGIVINRKQEYNISVKQYLSESNNLTYCATSNRLCENL